jgi:hypothetical protein
MLAVLDGEGMNADDAAWALIADAAQVAIRLPGLSACATDEMAQLRAASLRAAGLPSSPEGT